MAYVPPTRAEILQRVKADMRVELGVDPLRRTIEYALARALVSQSKGRYSYLQYIFRQCFADTADAFFFWRWAGFFGIEQRPATGWTSYVVFTGVNGTNIPQGTEVSRVDGIVYETLALGTISGGEASILAQATTGGSNTNNDPGDLLSLVNPIVDIDTEVTVDAEGDETVDGSDVETQADGLERLLQHLGTPPAGGGPGDYVRWALEVPGVTRAWEFANLEAANSVSVAFVRDNDGSGVDIIPGAGELAEVLEYLQERAPITVDVRVITVVAQVIDFDIADLVDDTPETRDSIEASLIDLFAREGGPGETIALSRIDAAISAADGEESHTLVDPIAAVTSTTAQVPIVGTIVYT